MKCKGINYDVGTFTTQDSSSRPEFDQAVVEGEIGIIKNDLHCTAIRISGQDLERLLFATQSALKQGLEVWFSPALINAAPAETLDYLRECARAVEPLRARWANVVFVTGTELTFFMKELVLGDLLAIFEAEKLAGAFVFTFVMPEYPYRADPQLDQDMASYAIVKSYTDRLGVTYPDLPWEPKQAFTTLAAIYGQ